MTDFDPELYCLLHRGNPGDLAFYRALCAGARSVLELGVGEGRVAIPLVQQGAEVVGLESHPGMLARAEAARRRLAEPWASKLTLVAGDMRAFSLNQRFERVIVPFNGIYCLPDDQAVIDCLRCAAQHLTPDGQVIFDGYLVGDLSEAPPEADEPAFLTRLSAQGRTWRVYESDRHDPERRHFAVTYQHLSRGRAELRYTLNHHYLAPEALPVLLSEAGLKAVNLYGGFGGQPFDEAAEHFIAVAGLASPGAEP